MYLSSGEKHTVHISTGPTSMPKIFSPDSKSHTLKLESKELDAHSIEKTKNYSEQIQTEKENELLSNKDLL